jgi:mRNA interferase RelE/StbE
MFKLLYTKEARDNIDKLTIKKKRQIKEGLERIAMDPEIGKGLSGSLKGIYSYRSGDYRIIYRVIRGEITIIVLTVGHRQDVYDKLTRKIRGITGLSVNE